LLGLSLTTTSPNHTVFTQEAFPHYHNSVSSFLHPKRDLSSIALTAIPRQDRETRQEDEHQEATLDADAAGESAETEEMNRVAQEYRVR
jgi:hypothetical protein